MLTSYRLFFVFLVAVVFALLANPMYQRMTVDSLEAQVNHKERVCSGRGENHSCSWMVLTDQMSFVNEDALWHWKFDSTDLQSKIEVGETYVITYYGWRVPFLSAYPNIIRVSL